MRAAILVALLASLAAAAFAFRLRTQMVDFEVYRTAGARAAIAEPLYRDADEHYQFKYFPAFAFVFVPAAALPLVAAKAIWFAVSMALLVGFVALSLRELPARVMPAPLIVIVTVLTLGKFYAHELTLGQANLLFGAVTMAALAAVQRGHARTAGLLFGASVIAKPYGLLFVPYLLAARRLTTAATAALVVALAAALPVLAYGADGNVALMRDWWTTVTGSIPANLTNQDNVSIAAMYAKWLGPGTLADGLTVATSLVLVALCGAVIALRRPAARREFNLSRATHAARPEYLEIALLLTAVALLSPQGWDYVLLLSTPAVMLLVNALPTLPRLLQVVTATCLALTGLSIYDIMGRAAYSRFMALSILTVIYGVLIGMMVYIRARRLE